MRNKYAFDKEKTELLYGDDFSCKLCGGNNQLERHHITKKLEFSNSIYNLLWICKNCHSKYGSTSAGDTKKHLQIAKKVTDQKIKLLEKNDMYFSKEKFLTETDYKFLEKNKKYYEK